MGARDQLLRKINSQEFSTDGICDGCGYEVADCRMRFQDCYDRYNASGIPDDGISLHSEGELMVMIPATARHSLLLLADGMDNHAAQSGGDLFIAATLWASEIRELLAS